MFYIIDIIIVYYFYTNYYELEVIKILKTREEKK